MGIEPQPCPPCSEGGGEGTPLVVEDEGGTVVGAASRMNFVGPVVVVTNAGGGEALVTLDVDAEDVGYVPVVPGVVTETQLQGAVDELSGGLLVTNDSLTTLTGQVVFTTGNQSVDGVKTFTSDPIIPDEAYNEATWNGVLEPATKNAVRDALEAFVEIFADEPLELQIDPDGRITILTTIARQSDLLTAMQYAAPIICRKTSDQDLTTTSAVDITEMAITGLLASSRYQIEGLIHYDGPTGASNLVPSFTVPAGASGHQHIIGPSSAETGIAPAASVPFRQRAWTSSEEFGGVGAGVNATTWLRGYLITSSAGTLQMQGRQSAGPDAIPITILTGSYMIARYIGAA